MDMSKSYQSAARQYLPDVDIVFDRFHVMALTNRALDKVRRQECNKLSKDECKVFKGSRFLFLGNYHELESDKIDQLNSLLAVNIPLFRSHALKEQLRLFWELESREDAEKFLRSWVMGAWYSGVKPMQSLALTLWRHQLELLNYFKHRISNGKAEGINNKIKTLKRQAYGFRDMHYFKLRLYHLHAQKYSLSG